MRKVFIFMTLAFACTFMANAQNVKFGHINTDELVGIMPERDSMDLKLRAFVNDHQEILKGMNEEYNKKIDEFSANQDKWSSIVKENKQAEIIELQTRFSKFQQEGQQKLAAEQERLFAPIREKIKSTIDKVAKANGFTYIFDISTGNPIYWSETQSTDILPLVKKELGIK
ncbi:MAG: OmpH family outer membrane protein [Prevotellaceae bacterium]|jgi:outer membrane protein|nr:OmpH family outer membrane protein [Prevotellaceae bacterium]